MIRKKVLSILIFTILGLIYVYLPKIKLLGTLIGENQCWCVTNYDYSKYGLKTSSNLYSFKWNLENELYQKNGDHFELKRYKPTYWSFNPNNLFFWNKENVVVNISSDTVVFASYGMPFDNTIFLGHNMLAFKDSTSIIWQTYYLVKRECPEKFILQKESKATSM